MEAIETELKTLPELAQILGIKKQGRELTNHFRHLSEEHGLELSGSRQQPCALIEDVLAAQTECDESCGAGIVEHIDTEAWSLARRPTLKEQIQAAEAAGLISEAEVIKKAKPRIEKIQGTTSKPACIKIILDMNVQPELALGSKKERRYYNPELVEEAIERWELFNKDSKQRRQTSKRPHATRSLQEVLEQTGGVLRREILARFGLDVKSPGVGNSFMIKLKNVGLEPIDRFGNAFIYDLKQVDELSHLDPEEDWPARINQKQGT